MQLQISCLWVSKHSVTWRWYSKITERESLMYSDLMCNADICWQIFVTFLLRTAHFGSHSTLQGNLFVLTAPAKLRINLRAKIGHYHNTFFSKLAECFLGRMYNYATPQWHPLRWPNTTIKSLTNGIIWYCTQGTPILFSPFSSLTWERN